MNTIITTSRRSNYRFSSHYAAVRMVVCTDRFVPDAVYNRIAATVVLDDLSKFKRACKIHVYVATKMDMSLFFACPSGPHCYGMLLI
jgi:hypothetical protein